MVIMVLQQRAQLLGVRTLFCMVGSRVGQKCSCEDRPMLEITLLRLCGALISCMGLQRAVELRIGRAWHKCAAEAFDCCANEAVARPNEPVACDCC